MDEDVAWVISAELRLLTPEVRRSAAEVERLLHPDFVEFGASGRRWDRAEMIAAIGEELTDGEVPAVSAVNGVRLADAVVLVTYVTERPDRRARRSSLWRRVNDGTWRLYFHQGTVLTAGA
ncbi:MAG TPA: nuclear transport factor 2 family protein [Pseudonocardiaceae bacterium]|jgi:hypothetical protein|nr:nuclear transport factor 2 family protein [Pseudonocardiaceae bacterium]